MKNLYILGAGDLGREIESWFDKYSPDKDKFRLIGYLDDDLNALMGFPSDYKILGTISDFELSKNDWVILAIASPAIREKIYKKIVSKTNIYTFIPKNSIVGKFSHIGEGSILCPNSIISTNVRLGKCVILNIGTQLGHDSIINDFCSIMANVDLGGGVSLGKNVYIGSNSTLIPQISIGDYVTVGAGSIVIKSISTQQTVFGNPAKRIQ